ncbi:unconventional prefoldin RPB5 interactor-like [Harmonia axyridis]|uniref:unconventional prefoldin RPB5 interactor-like n=1 Tax=Harmonia axyridis TaxID=115357 RepID=UPI001E275975|nr:unconventional prefoldin RPB5 interactor-like [Harmonia axyridis]
MNEKALKTLASRSEFKIRLEEEIGKNKEIIKNKTGEIDKISETISNIKLLGDKPEWDSLIPLGKRIYIPGKIVHTGEYFLEKKSYPYSYSVLTTLQKTIDILKEKKERNEEHLDRYLEIEKQLQERIEYLVGRDGDSDFPDNIVSDKGVAVRVGDVYEILEYEE